MNKVVTTLCLLLAFANTLLAQDDSDSAAIELPQRYDKTDHHGQPWVKNISRPFEPTRGLQGRHLSLWASHGRYYDQKKEEWRWQRPRLFGTCEDLFTQTIVVPYLIPMLELAGAYVFTPRERDWQRHEVIVDNDGPRRNYIEATAHSRWHDTGISGFALHGGAYEDNENPFEAGTARMAKTTTSKNRYSLASYQPDFPETGRYAVYVSYQTLPNSIDRAEYTVWHRGERTVFHVNQQMGGGTWVYLGTFEFDKGYSEYNRVTLTNQSSHSGVVTTDAVRFGGGMGNIQRGGTTSGMPRALEGARYYAQWAGMPYSIYSGREGTDDYADDINVRSRMTNYLAGGSAFVPDSAGLGVPLELSLAVHSDAGFAQDGESLVGSLAICTTSFHDGRLAAGISRQASYQLASQLLGNVTREMRQKYGKWERRYLWDRNYSETRLPEVPSAILETLSHQNFPDMRYGQDPNFRFSLARTIYKTLLRYIGEQHGIATTVAPLPPTHFTMHLKDNGTLQLRWAETADTHEPTARATGYIVYTAIGGASFDNGTYISSRTSHEIELKPNTRYDFRVTAVNDGGESFPTEQLSALYNPNARQTVMIVNGFQRLSSPAIRNTSEEQGFDIDDDPGVTYGPTLGWVGRQQCFDRTNMGTESEDGLGYSGEELAGQLIAGNDFNYVATHAEAIASAQQYNIVSTSAQAVSSGAAPLKGYAAVDLLLGLERDDGHSLVYYKTFTPAMQQALRNYTKGGGRLLVSGAYVATDMQKPSEQQFLSSVLKLQLAERIATESDAITGMGTTLHYHNTLNSQHYAATSVDALQPMKPAYATLRYDNGQDAAVAYKGSDYRVFTMGFPFECIKSEKKRASIMRGILNYLLK